MSCEITLGRSQPVYSHLYVHVPFCARRCSYCDFSIAVRREVPVAAYVASVVAELVRRAKPADVESMDTVYMGGGTPTKLGAAGVQELISGLRSAGVGIAADAEVTIEANPEDVSAEAVTGWLKAGVNRLSLGVQSLAGPVLEWMHRTHDAGQAVAAYRTARAGGIGNISIDIIYGLPDRLHRDWSADLDQVVALEPDHLSLYGLTVEPRTPLGRWTARGTETPAEDERSAEEFLVAHDRLRSAGFEHYEVSSYARPGSRSRHNGSYWRRVPYLGLGPSAHSFDGAKRRWNTSAFAEWETILAAGNDAIAGEEALTPAQVLAESLYLGLRTDGGAVLTDPADRARAATWKSAGWATIGVERSGPLSADRVRLTAEGWLRLDALAGTLGAS